MRPSVAPGLRAPVVELFGFISANRFRIGALLGLHILLLLTIGVTNTPFWDDAGRQIWGQGLTNWSTDGRWGSHFAGLLLNGTRYPRLADLGLATFLISALVLTVVSIVVVRCLPPLRASDAPQKAGFVAMVCALGVGLNPWSLGILAFRFDGPFGALAILFAVAPILWITSRGIATFGAAAACMWLVANFYQPASGIGVALVIVAIGVRYLVAEFSLAGALRQLGWYLLGSVAGAAAYAVQHRLMNGTDLPPIGGAVQNSGAGGAAVGQRLGVLGTFGQNLAGYFSAYQTDSPNSWLMGFGLVLVAFAVIAGLASRRRYWQSISVIAVILIVAGVISGSFLLFTEQGWIFGPPRFRMGLAALVAGLAVFAASGRLDIGRRWRPFALLALIPFIYVLVTFPLVFAHALYVQDQAFAAQTQRIFSNVEPQLRPGDQVAIDEVTTYYDSPAFIQASLNFPMVGRLIPSNTGLWSWTQYARITELTGLPFGAVVPMRGDGSSDMRQFLPNGTHFWPNRGAEPHALNIWRCGEMIICVNGW